jgi:hypothetical protein
MAPSHKPKGPFTPETEGLDRSRRFLPKDGNGTANTSSTVKFYEIIIAGRRRAGTEREHGFVPNPGQWLASLLDCAADALEPLTITQGKSSQIW